MKYRPEIDGLRTVAVISVILYHVGMIFTEIDFFPYGGFLGVDIFFVISGYLISYKLIERINSGSYSLMTFYESRSRRIIL